MKNLKEKFLKRKFEKRASAVGFRIDEIGLPNGKKAVREYIDHPGAVAALPFIGKNKIILVKQFRYPVGEITWEIPAGKLHPGENPISCIRRELEEETGYKAGKIKKLISFWPTAAFVNEIIHIYSTHNLVKGQMNLDDDEFLKCEIWSLNQAYAAIGSGKIKDSKTIIALLVHQSQS